ncbi:AraC family transcriptional regulator [Thalassospira marina]|uniref:AraC family transcriptional regulator n=1 Tax=Thalassospira marina TaxID=2048283 RepID=A0A2N3KZW3_9PROT|nr:AraC family transcriptional regulator [Thalassospira marina]PKR56010.1 AraC family transcriptional regulator [Thalassospira marina]
MTAKPQQSGSNQRFWHDTDVPFIEARFVREGRDIRSDKHTHDTFSIGAILGGASACHMRRAKHELSTGTVIFINPEDVHDCHPLVERGWAFQMLYVDTGWLLDVQAQNDADANGKFAAYDPVLSQDPVIFAQLTRLGRILADHDIPALGKEEAATAFFSLLAERTGRGKTRLYAMGQGGVGRIAGMQGEKHEGGKGVLRAAEYIRAHCEQPLRLNGISEQAGMTPSALVRAFGQQYGITPHAYLMNCRIQRARHALKRGERIVDVALACGFADQAHFQRIFKRQMTATPRQYAHVMRA